VLRLGAEGVALEIRDLQVAPASQGQGIGTWAIQQAKSLASGRGFEMVRLRVFEENPARSLYARLGFVSEAIVAGKVHMAFAAQPGAPGVVAPAGMTWEQRA
jgi:GNAT superfamily N-acetyltransferase